VRTQVLNGDGYTIELLLPAAVRYKVGDHSLTLPSNVMPLRTDNHWWTILTGWYTPFYVETPMVWDDEEEPMSVSEAETAIARIKEFLDIKLKKRYRFLPWSGVVEMSWLPDKKKKGRLFRKVPDALGRLDPLINNAAISNTRKTPSTSLQEYAKISRPSNVPLDELRGVGNQRVRRPRCYPCCRSWHEAPAAHIVNVSSGVGSPKANADPALWLLPLSV
jgi:hypothetical protein